MEDHEIVPEDAIGLQRREEVVRVFIEVGNQRDDALAPEVLGHLLKRIDHATGPFGSRAIEGVQQHVEVFGGGGHIRHHILIERDDSDPIPLPL